MKSFFVQFSTIILLISAYLHPALVLSSFAATTPSFPICSNPQGEVKVSYSSGTHGIVGDSKEYTGSDTVYKLSADTLTQCFCANDGTGIQTNWWKISNLTDSEVQVLKNLGWQYIPTGAVWGLDDAPYVAQNSTYSCKGGSAGGSSTTSSNTGGIGGESVLGAAASVLGLANTGNISLIYSLFGAGSASLLLGFVLRKNR